MSTDLPFNCDYAKSGRASCKQCRNLISKDTLRLAVMVQSPVFDGKMPMWHHVNCFFKKKNSLKSTDDIANFQNLRWEDQEKIKELIRSTSKEPSEDSEFSVEKAKSARSACKICGLKIEKGAVRISKVVWEPGSKRGPLPRWHHADCFAQNKEDLEFNDLAADIPGFETLSEEDQNMLTEKIGTNRGEKRKADPEPSNSKKTCVEDKLFKAQNKMLFDMRDNLAANFSKKEVSELLEFNNQHIPTGESRKLDHLADCLVFGALKECPECKNARPRFLVNVYQCPGYLTEWSKCQYETKFPAREKFNVPPEYKEKFSFLNDFKSTIRERSFPETSDSSLSRKNLPLSDFIVSVIGNKSFISLNKKLIEDCGGYYTDILSPDVHFIISTKSEMKSKKMDSVKRMDIHVVSAKIFESLRKGSPVGHSVKEHCICTWGVDPILKLGIKRENSAKKKAEVESMIYKSAPKKIKVSVKGVAAVDPESGLENSCHVYKNKDDIYNAVLTLVDTVRGTNSFYKIQLLKSNHSSKYHVFRQWGRVGTTIGGKKIEKYDSLEEAIDQFEILYLEKSGNEWWNRKDFVKRPGMMYPVDIDYGEEDVQTEMTPTNVSKLPKPVQELVCLIFDVEAMKKTMLEFEIDLKKMPLGKLSRKQIESAYKVLSEAQQILSSGYSASKIMDASNRFYTLIPHDFGMRKPPQLDDQELIKSKVEMLDSLLEIAFAYSLLKREQTQKDPVTESYEKLHSDISVLEKDSNEYKMVKTYLNNTHAPTHFQYKLKLEEVYRINRHGEEDKYSKFKDLHNKKLLWHGSRLTNYVGILSQGLRIAPPEAPISGYMFGKGVYFADMVSKSANYCWATHQNTTGLLLLCEVALGNMYERTHSEFVEKLPAGMHSTKGLGITIPNPKGAIIKDDVEIPCGKPIESEVENSALLYNEYIVYDVSQIKIKYLLKVNFKYNL